MTEVKDDAFDQALELTFPASDPIGVGGITGSETAEAGIEPTEASDTSPPSRVIPAGEIALPQGIVQQLPALARALTSSLFAALLLGLATLATSPQLLANDAAIIGSDRANRLASVLGIEVRSAGKTIGRIVDLLARQDGTVEAAVIEYAGFLGIGSRKVAVGWSHLRFERAGTQLYAITDLGADELASSADY